eukprot:14417267-Ditylum_brightwellii.AAC.1
MIGAITLLSALCVDTRASGCNAPFSFHRFDLWLASQVLGTLTGLPPTNRLLLQHVHEALTPSFVYLKKAHSSLPSGYSSH